ncbi:uncharacterized protein [Elaeis guineensis]|uniref:uncharacterized protein n=1 Tax=Elaeis guineensis var. tenera TaxID=51953 RepID=UPI003C6DA6C8
MAASNLLAWIIETNHLTGPNFKDWLRNLKIILSSKKIAYVLDQDLTPLPAHLTPDQRASHEKWLDDDNKVRCYVMSNELQCQHENMKTARQILSHLQELYDEQSCAVCYEMSK